MTPLGAGPTGYRDYQRTSALDSPPLFKQPLKEIAQGFSEPRANVSSWQNLVGKIVLKPGSGKVSYVVFTLQWFAEKEAEEPIAEEQIVLATATTGKYGPFEFNIPNNGPWVSMEVTRILEKPSFEAAWTVSGSNRRHILISPIAAPAILTDEKLLPPGVPGLSFPVGYYAGPMQVSAANSAIEKAVAVNLIVMNTNGTHTAVDTHALEEKGEWYEFKFVTPAGVWWIETYNGGGENTNVTVRCSPSQTGAT